MNKYLTPFLAMGFLFGYIALPAIVGCVLMQIWMSFSSNKRGSPPPHRSPGGGDSGGL